MGFGYTEIAIDHMGIYLIVATLTFRERNTRTNVLSLTLGPHGNNFEDIVEALGAFRSLDRETFMDWWTKIFFVCIFTLCFLKDMPQQQENARFNTQNAD